MGELGVLGPTIKGMHNISVPYLLAVDIRVELHGSLKLNQNLQFNSVNTCAACFRVKHSIVFIYMRTINE